MALAATTIWEVEVGGDDTNNGGAFDPGQTAGMFTDGAATSATGTAPVFSSASYNFVAGDVGAWVFIASGTNWTPGWYKITSVASNAATLSAAAGAAVQSRAGGAVTATSSMLGPSTVAGCATTASPTGATWSIDYSQQVAAQFAYTDLASVGAGLTVSSVAKPFAAQHVGNCLVITSGTNFTAGRYVIASVAAGVATVVGAAAITTGAGVSGVGGLGGAFASPAMLCVKSVGSNRGYIKTGTYTITSATYNISGGCLNPAAGQLQMFIGGYDTIRGDLLLGGAGTPPTLIASGISTFTLIANGGGGSGQMLIANLILDGASLTASRGMSLVSSIAYQVQGKNFTNSAFAGTTTGKCIQCSATGCSTQPAFTSIHTMIGCVAYANSITGFSSGVVHIQCLAYNNSGGSSDGIAPAAALSSAVNCTSYGNGRDGFRTGTALCVLVNCIAEANTGAGYTLSGPHDLAVNCAAYNNTGGNISAASTHPTATNFFTGTSSFFTNAAGEDFSLNNAAGGGSLLRQAGYPGALPSGGTGYLDVGALQHKDVAGGPMLFMRSRR